ncbi:MAG: oligosaccharide flippase family protein [Bacteroidia bacterium]|nr:oligosaccharide flippase family protein [Bacteroidia bacterium]NNJ54709.1 oligosaccharide flippase family protein [Bacteroidia bacterium]
MLKKYLSDIAFMQFLNLLIKPIWILIIDRAVQNALPHEVYGNYFALFNFSLMFFIILDLGLNGYNTTQVSRDSKKIATITGNILGLKILLSIFYTIIVFLVGSIFGYDSSEFGILAMLCILQIITSFNQYLRTIVSSLQKFKWDGVFMVLDRVVVISLCAILLWGGLDTLKLTIFNFIWAQIIGVGFVFVLLLVFLSRYLKSIRISFNLNKIIPLLKKSWPFALLVTLMGLYNYVDSVMLKSLVGDAKAGEYALGYRLFYALLMFAQIFSGVLLPFFSKNMVNREVIDRVSTYTFKLLFTIGVTVACICFAYQNELMVMLYPEKTTSDSITAFGILMFGFIGSAMVLVYGTLLTAMLNLKQLNIAAFITLVINLVLNGVLIPKYGATGAAIATITSQLLFGALCYQIAYKKIRFTIVKQEIIKQIVGLILLITVIIFGKQYFENVFVHVVMISLSILLVVYLYKLFEKKHLKSLVRK